MTEVVHTYVRESKMIFDFNRQNIFYSLMKMDSCHECTNFVTQFYIL